MLALTTTYLCNEWLDEQDRLKFERIRQTSARRARIECDGDWGISEGLIFENAKLEAFDVDALRADPNMKAAFGIDFGFTDPTCFVATLVDTKNMKIYVFDEFYKSGITTTQLAARIQAMGYGGQRIVCDSAEPKAIAELNDLGIKAIPSRKGRDSVLHGIQQLQNYEWIIHPKCKEVYREITNYAWALDKMGKPMDKPDHEFSHSMDALRYAITKMLVGSAYSFD